MPSYDDLDGKVVLVTGANGGMGLAISNCLAQAGALVVASDLQGFPNEALVDFRNLSYQSADVSKEGDVIRLLDTINRRHGRLDCAVNAAAIEFETQRLADCATSDFDRLLSINLRGTFLCMKYELQLMLGQASPGSIVNIASTNSFRAGRIQPAYTASKHAVVGLTRQAALDYAGDSIRVNAVAPGNIDTPMLRAALERRNIDAARAEATMPLGRFGKSEEIANAVLWLCSNASSFTTGHVLTVEGGMLIS